ncbi:MAG: GNAT family N-acetyltransferase [Nitrospira sp.]|nr:GNAT family N-acetyltransferase [Nitrospira sp.]
MTIRVRPADLSVERDAILAVLSRNLAAFDHGARFSWLYLNNPCGQGLSWVVYDTNPDNIVGVASLFPRAVRVGGKTMLCGQVGDFAVDQKYRTLGPALMLQRATFGPVAAGQMAFCYDCPPHEQGMSTFHRLGMKAQCQMVRYALLIRCDRKVEKLLGPRIANLGVAALVNLLLSIGQGKRRHAAGVDISRHFGQFGQEFSELDVKGFHSNVIRGRRLAEDLNWRYRDDPLRSYRVITARRAGELVAYAVSSVIEKDAYLVDMRNVDEPSVIVDLLQAMADEVKADLAQALQCMISDSHGMREMCEMAGLQYRSVAPRVVAYTSPGADSFSKLNAKLSWDFMHGDVLA